MLSISAKAFQYTLICRQAEEECLGALNEGLEGMRGCNKVKMRDHISSPQNFTFTKGVTDKKANENVKQNLTTDAATTCIWQHNPNKKYRGRGRGKRYQRMTHLGVRVTTTLETQTEGRTDPFWLLDIAITTRASAVEVRTHQRSGDLMVLYKKVDFTQLLDAQTFICKLSSNTISRYGYDRVFHTDMGHDHNATSWSVTTHALLDNRLHSHLFR